MEVEVIVDDDENLARFIFSNRHIRSSNNTVKPEAFMPHPRIDLSVSRHADLTESDIWALGEGVSEQRALPLIARADLKAHIFKPYDLRVIEAPVSGNPYHANVKDWPIEKAAQKMIAMEISHLAGEVKQPLSRE